MEQFVYSFIYNNLVDYCLLDYNHLNTVACNIGLNVEDVIGSVYVDHKYKKIRFFTKISEEIAFLLGLSHK